MIKIPLLIYIVFLYWAGFLCVDFKQDGGKVKYCNTKYIRNCYIFTGRRSRREPYRTNMSATTLMPYGNNVTFALVLRMKSGGEFRVAAKVCDTIKAKWMLEFMNHYSNVTVNHCPFPAAKYFYHNMELPPRNVPLPIADGDYYIKMELYITATKELIVDVETMLHFDSSNSGAKTKNTGRNNTRKG